jgi:hypothetical protein
MAHLHSTSLAADLSAARRHTPHARRARLMVVVSMFSAFGLVAVATALLARLI